MSEVDTPAEYIKSLDYKNIEAERFKMNTSENQTRTLIPYNEGYYSAFKNSTLLNSKFAGSQTASRFIHSKRKNVESGESIEEAYLDMKISP